MAQRSMLGLMDDQPITILVGVVVELDGQAFHSGTRRREADLDRDLALAADHGDVTLRIGFRQVFDSPCRTAERVAAVLLRRGWDGRPRRCPDCGGSQSPDDWDPPQMQENLGRTGKLGP